MATIPTPKTWAAGQWPVSEMNVHMRDTLGFFLQPPLCVVRKHKTPQGLPNNGFDPVTWDTVVYDSEGCFNTSDSTRLTAQTPGYYLFTLQLQWFHSTPNTDTRFHFIYIYNSADVVQEALFMFGNRYQQTSESYTSSAAVAMNAGDYAVAKARIWINATQLAAWDPPNGNYGGQFDMRWVSEL